MQIEEGEYYRTRDGRKVGPMKWGARNPYSKFGWVESSNMSHRWADDGNNAFGVGELDILKEWEETLDASSPISVTNTDENGVKHYLSDYPDTISAEIGGLYKEPTLWRDLTDEEKGALLLAYVNGKTIEAYGEGVACGWYSVTYPSWSAGAAYRVKPESVRETVTLQGHVNDWNQFMTDSQIVTHRITFNLIDGEPDTDSIKMENL